ncbi:hypothetical protein SDC9_71044 [bioreactor metagenome]|jgi:hypothetical protein|uniref:Uncharacterized protein n=1 Tax=bioreactor metagenome TaxID=1076179 RepID=A0A644Y9H0_9ZZZZ
MVMEKIMREQWGLTPLDEREMLQNGGLSLREIWNYLTLLGEVLKKAEKYWPSFKHGFVDGWEAA